VDTLVDLLKTAKVSFGARPALTMHTGLREDSWSYDRLWDSAHAVARYLGGELGLARGSRVLVWGPNSPQLAATYFGTMLAGMILVPIDPLSNAGFVERVLDKTEGSVVITGFPGGTFGRAQTIAIADLPLDTPGPPIQAMPFPADVAEIVFTSGTTGAPKGVILTHRNIVANVRSASRLVPARDYRLLSILPLSHMLEQTMGLYVPLLFGGTVHYTSGRHPRVIAAAMRRYRVTTLVLVPQVLELMYRGIEHEVEARNGGRKWRLAHSLAPRLPMPARRVLFRQVLAGLGGALDFVICGGARLSDELMLGWERMGVRVIVGYGTTECAPLVAGNSYTERVPGSVGRSAAGVQVRLTGESEILVKGANVTPGYWEDTPTTTAAFEKGGWYRTGDLGSFDNDGHLFLTGRLRDLIVLPNGLNVYPEDVEEQLLQEPDIADCVVVPLPDATGNVTVHAVVIPSRETSDPIGQPDRVAAAVRTAAGRLVPHQRVSGFTIWDGDDFPRTNLRKVKRHEVASVAAGKTRPPGVAAAPSGDPHFDQVRRLLATVTGEAAPTITPATHLEHDLNLDSLGRVELAVALEADLGAALEEGHLSEVGTVGDLMALLDRSDAAPVAPVFPEWGLRPAVATVRRLLQTAILFPIHRLFARPFVVEGEANLRGLESPLLFIANHTSHFDTPSILRALPYRLRQKTAVAAAADYFYASRMRGAVMTLVLNTFPFSREGAVRSSLEHCGDLADAGWSVLIYPEGTRSPTGSLDEFRSGIGLLAEQLRVPVIPIGVIGAYALMPKGSYRPRVGPLVVRFGEPIWPKPGSDRTELIEALELAVAGQLSRVAVPA
jgi:long-chain acyl-CoA synthetase